MQRGAQAAARSSAPLGAGALPCTRSCCDARPGVTSYWARPPGRPRFPARPELGWMRVHPHLLRVQAAPTMPHPLDPRGCPSQSRPGPPEHENEHTFGGLMSDASAPCQVEISAVDQQQKGTLMGLEFLRLSSPRSVSCAVPEQLLACTPAPRTLLTNDVSITCLQSRDVAAPVHASSAYLPCPCPSLGSDCRALFSLVLGVPTCLSAELPQPLLRLSRRALLCLRVVPSLPPSHGSRRRRGADAKGGSRDPLGGERPQRA